MVGLLLIDFGLLIFFCMAYCHEIYLLASFLRDVDCDVFAWSPLPGV